MHTAPKNALTAALAKRRQTTPQLSDYPQLALAATSSGPASIDPMDNHFASLMATLEMLGRLNLGARNAHALGLLSQHGPLRASDLADRLHVSASAASLILSKLEPLGLITVQRGDLPQDRRQVIATLTQAGTNVLSCIVAMGALATAAADLRQLRTA